MTGRPDPEVAVDCRWLGRGGPGRITELLLRGLAAAPPPGQWLLWGPAAIGPLAWADAEVRTTESDPHAMAGQRPFPRLPRHDVAVFMHQLRPLWRVPSLTLIHDTIPLRFASSAVEGRTKALYLRRVAAISSVIATNSEYSKRCIQRDLGVAEETIEVLPIPFDDASSARVVELRRHATVADTALFVGRFAPHKNLPRLAAAFARTAFARGGGRLVLVGGTGDEIRDLIRQLTPRVRSITDLRPACPQAELDRLLATARFVVQPSLEEGFGLPAWEALSCGIPLCISDGGALPEITRGLVKPFPAESVDAMTTALDECAERARTCPQHALELRAELRRQAATTREFAQAFLAALARVEPS